MSFQLPEAVVDTLLDKLGSDDAFRAQFVSDTRGALASIGFEAAADASVSQGIWACMSVTDLASKEVIRASRVELSRQLSKKGVFSPFHLEAGRHVRAA